MQNFGELVRAAREKTLQDNLSVSEDMQQRLAGAMQTRILKQLCALLLDPDMPDEQAITRARALCLQAQLFFREHGSSPPGASCTWNKLTNSSRATAFDGQLPQPALY